MMKTSPRTRRTTMTNPVDQELALDMDRLLDDMDFQMWLEVKRDELDARLPGGLQGASPEFVFGGPAAAYQVYLKETAVLPSRKEPPMPVSRKKRSKKKSPVRKRRGGGESLSLPTEPTAISDEVNDYSFLIHGEKKIGKTTLATQAPDVLVLSFDPPRPGLSIMQRHCPDWKTLKRYVELLEEQSKSGDFNYSRVVLDRVDLAYTCCQHYICKEFNVNHPSEVDWARAWHALRDEFTDVIIRLMNLPCGTWFICHSEWKEQKIRGVSRTKLVPELANRAEEALNGLVDGWFAYDYVGEERILVLLGDDAIGAGHALDTHFLTPDGKRIRELHMGRSAKAAWDNFNAAFENRHPYVDYDEQKKATRPVKKKVTKKKRRTTR